MAATKQLKQKYAPEPAPTTPTPLSKADRYRQSLDRGVMMDTIAYFGHHNIHAGTSDPELMDRLLTDVAENSAFENPEQADDYISEALYTRMGDIVDWIEHAEFGERKAFDADFDGETVGRGFVMNRENQTIQEYTTDMVRLVLKQDNSNQYGFSLLTAFPSMMTPDIQPTGRDLTPVIQQTPTYQEASPVKRAYLNYRGKPDNNILVTYRAGQEPSDDCLNIHVPTNNPNIQHRLRIKEAGASLTTVCDGEKIESDFTAMRDMLLPKHKGKPNVFLNNPAIRKAFCDTYPEYGRVLNDLQTTIRSETQTNYTPQSSATPYKTGEKIPLPNPGTTNTHEDRVKKAERVSDNIQSEPNNGKGAMQILMSLVLVCVIALGALLSNNTIFAEPLVGNAGIDMAEQTNAVAETISNAKYNAVHIKDPIPTETVSIIETEPAIIEPEEPTFFSDDTTFDYTYVMPDNGMPYALYTPSSVNPEEPTALLVWLHGSGERNVDYNTFLSRGLPAVLNDWKLAGFNAYIICPHLTGEYDSAWNTEKSMTNLQNLLNAVIAEYNIDANNIAIAGHSLGGQGVLYMAHKLPDYFGKAAVLSGYDPDVKESEITLPLISYVGTHDAGEDSASIRYTMTTLATTFGDNNTTQIDSSHGELPRHVFNLDIDANNESDIITWLFSNKISNSEEPVIASLNKNTVSSVPLFFQTDYPDIPYSHGTVATSGCGISCLSMVASYQTGIIYTPGTLAKYNDSGYDNGTRMENAAIALDLHFEKSWRWRDVIDALENDQLVIVLVGGGTIFTNGGHFIVLTGITDDGKIMVNDPYEPNYKRIGDRYFTGFDESDITCDFNGAWIFDKK